MKNKISLLFSLLLLVSTFTFCGEESKKDEDTLILIETSYGNIKARLYNETPEHRNNFIALIEKGFYDSLLFHRVIENFMLQGGDPDSKNAKKGEVLGQGGPNYKIPAEIRSKFFHKRGALAAARQNDALNPKKMSSGSQFYIVTGKKYTNDEIDKVEKQVISAKLNKRVENLLYTNMTTMKIIRSLERDNKQKELDSIKNRAREKIKLEYKDEKKFFIPKAHREIYSTQGGIPFLDGGYTVFGEVTEGLEVLDKISKIKTGKFDRPEKDIRMKITILN